MKLNTIIKIGDRIGTICYNQLDGRGGVWGKRHFTTRDLGHIIVPDQELPPPEFLLREKEYQERARENFGYDIECVGEDFEVVKERHA